MKKIRKAVFPVAGLGSRFLPATKSVPKEMFPVVDKPLIQYGVEEATNAGIEEFIFVVSPHKRAIQDHFQKSLSLEKALEQSGKQSLIDVVRDCQLRMDRMHVVVQEEPVGLGHAILCAKNLVGDEPFAVLLPDDLVLSTVPCLDQMICAYPEHGGNLIAITEVDQKETDKYGILLPGTTRGKLVEIKGLVEKPAPSVAPSRWAIIGRYILEPVIFGQLEKQQQDRDGEIQLTDTMAALLKTEKFDGYRFDGERYDCGDRIGFLEANIGYGLARKDLRDDIVAALKRFSLFLRDE